MTKIGKLRAHPKTPFVTREVREASSSIKHRVRLRRRIPCDTSQKPQTKHACAATLIVLRRSNGVFGWASRVFLFVSLFVATLTAMGNSPSISVQASINQPEVAPRETLQLVLAVISDQNVEIQEPSVGEIPGFQKIQSWNAVSQNSTLQTVRDASGSRMEMKTVHRHEFNYSLLAEKEGEFKIPEFTIVVDGKAYKTQSFMVRVSQSAAGRGRGAQGNQMPFSDDEEEEDPVAQLYNQILRNRGLRPQAPGGPQENPPLNVNPKETFFVHVDVDKKEVFEGEQVTATWSIYTRGPILSLDRLKFPDLKGFWKEIIEEVPSLQFSQEILNGIAYRKALLASHALFPIKAGVSVIDEYKVKATIQTGSPFGFGGGSGYAFTRASDRVKINVKPLPREGRPKNFSGAVGNFDVKSVLGAQQFSLNQPFSLRLRFEGRGNAKLIELPPIDWPVGLELYDKKEESKFSKDGTSYKEFELLLIPRSVGEMNLPAVELSQFDPQKKTYVSKSSAPIKIQVAAATDQNIAGGGALMSGSPGEPVTGKAAEVQGPRLPILALSINESILNQAVFLYLYWTVLILLSLGLLGFKYRKEFHFQTEDKIWLQQWDRKSSEFDKLLKEKNWKQAAVAYLNLVSFVLSKLSSEAPENLEVSHQLELLPLNLKAKYATSLREAHDFAQNLAFAPQQLRDQLVASGDIASKLKSSRQVVRGLLGDILKSRK